MKNSIFEHWKTSLQSFLILGMLILHHFDLINTEVMGEAIALFTSLGFISSADANKYVGKLSNTTGIGSGRNLKYMIVLLILPISLSSCSPELQKSIQKYAYDASIMNAIKVAKEKFPDKDILLRQDNQTNSFNAQSDIFQYKVSDISDSTRNLNRAIDWLHIAEVLIKEGHKWIDEGHLVIKSKKAQTITRLPRDSLSVTGDKQKFR